MARSPGEGHSTHEHVLSKALGKLIEHAWPVLPWLLIVLLAAVIRVWWPGIWTSAYLAAGGCTSAALIVLIGRGRSRMMGALTVLAAFGWLAAVSGLGFTHALAGAWFTGGGTVVVIWMLHIGHRGGSSDLAVKLENAAERAGLEGMRVRHLKLWPSKQTGTIRLAEGKTTPEDLARRVTHIEGAAGLPPGSLITKANADHAAEADFTISDPRILNKSLPFPGPSAPGASIAQPVCPGIWQDGSPVRYTVIGHHVQVMGKTGSAKSTGAGWNELAETITRHDAAVFGFDITKGSQFLGPFAPALHKLITDGDEMVAFMPRLHKCVKARADDMARQKLTRWQEGCDLTHLTFLFEEFPDIYNLMAEHDLDEKLMSVVKAIRSAGGRLIFSLQRSDFTQMPTLARGQLAKWCFGVDSAADADFGLSEIQKDRNCRPELWAETQPGKCYLDAPTIEDTYKAMPMRTWYWGEDTAKVEAYAAQYPAAARPLDAITASELGIALPSLAPAAAAARGQQPAREQVRLAAVPARLEDEDGSEEEFDVPDGSAAIEWDPDSPAGRFTVEDGPPVRKLSPEHARQVFRDRLAELAAQGRSDLSIEDLADLPDLTGHSRQWLYLVIREFESDAVLRKQGSSWPTRWAISQVAA